MNSPRSHDANGSGFGHLGQGADVDSVLAQWHSSVTSSSYPRYWVHKGAKGKACPTLTRVVPREISSRP